MGRLDDAAKYKVVELRKAGLSFRKIKAVLELENIKVSAQAIYLYLREFQGRPPGRVRPAEAGGSTVVAQVPPRSGALRESWSNNHLQNLIRESPHHSGFASASGFPKQSSSNSETSGNASSSGETSGGSRLEQQHAANKEENDIQIVSVTSLAQQEQKRVPQTGNAVEASASSTSTASNVFMRRRVTPSPATTSILAARRRLLDKALSHKTKVLSLLRKDPSSLQSCDLKSALSQLPETYDLTTEKTVIDGQLRGDGSSRNFPTQRPGLSLRSFQVPPRVGIRLPNRPQPPLTSSASRPSLVHLQTPGSQAPTCREGNPSPHQAVQDSGGRSGLQDQIQVLGTEVRSLGLAVKMLVEQQCRLEREQLQQTQIQKQILSTLQSFASKIGHCSSGRQQLNKTPSPSSLPAASGPSSFSQDSFSFSQGAYNQCSQTQPNYKSLENLQNVEAMRLPALSPTNMNGFPSCSNAENHPLSHSTPQSQPYPTAYTPQSSQTLVPPYSESYISSYSKSHTQNFKTPESKTSDFTSSCSRIFQDCSLSTQQGMNSSLSAQDQQINSIKVEGP